ncbi:MAG TPA: hypothetical protein VFZ71_02895 [Pyrinomonadaceae bacterium]
MAINRNITMGAIGAGRRASEDGGAAPPTPPARGGALATAVSAAAPFMTAPPVSVAAQPPPGQPITEPPAASSPASMFVNTAALRDLRDFGVRTPPVFEIPPVVFRPPIVDKTTTQIAQGALNQLRGAAPAAVREAVSNIKNKNIAAGDLLNYLERRTRVGEVLNELANDWSAQTKQDFSEAFQMPNTADKLPVMDAMVSIAILNDPDLKNELQAENTTEASQGDMLENRRIVWQWPQPGTPFTPPYLMLVAVERQDTTQAQNIIQSIIGDLVDFQGYKIPTAAANKLR